MKMPVHKILLTVLIVLGVFILINGEFFWQSLRANMARTFGQSTILPPAPEKNKVNPKTDVQPENAPLALWIPSLNLALPIIYVDKVDEVTFQAGLKWGVVHYPGTANIGEAGNAYIFGHSSDYIWSDGHFKTAFASLPKIEIGAIIIAKNETGETFTYKVVSKKVVAKDDITVLDQGDGQKKILTLQTSYPVGTAQKRFVAVAEVVDVGTEK